MYSHTHTHTYTYTHSHIQGPAHVPLLCVNKCAPPKSIFVVGAVPPGGSHELQLMVAVEGVWPWRARMRMAGAGGGGRGGGEKLLRVLMRRVLGSLSLARTNTNSRRTDYGGDTRRHTAHDAYTHTRMHTPTHTAHDACVDTPTSSKCGHTNLDCSPTNSSCRSTGGGQDTRTHAHTRHNGRVDTHTHTHTHTHTTSEAYLWKEDAGASTGERERERERESDARTRCHGGGWKRSSGGLVPLSRGLWVRVELDVTVASASCTSASSASSTATTSSNTTTCRTPGKYVFQSHTCGMTQSYVWHDSFVCVT